MVNAVKVLVIDDEPMICWAIEETLRAAGYEVAVATTAAEGMALFHRLLPDVALVDLRLPDENGLTVLKRMKEDQAQGTAVIIMTAFVDGCGADQARRLGAHGYIEKPLRFDELEALVRGVCRTTRPRREASRPDPA